MNGRSDILFKSVQPTASPGPRAAKKVRRNREDWRAWVAILISALAVAAAAWWHAHKQNLATGSEHSPDAINALAAVAPLAIMTVKTQDKGRSRSITAPLP